MILFSFYLDISCEKPPKVKNAIILSEKLSYLPGQTARYECNKPFDLFGEVEVTCLNGTWTEPPKCAGKVSYFPSSFREYIRD